MGSWKIENVNAYLIDRSPLGCLRETNGTNYSNKNSEVKNLNWKEADQLAVLQAQTMS